MAKVKSKLFNTVNRSLASPTRYAGVVGASDLVFLKLGPDVVMRTKPHSPKPPTEAQQAQQQLWKDADCMWRYLTPGQRVLWGYYYSGERRAGRTIASKGSSSSGGLDPIPPKDMGQMSYFMSHGLQWDLIEYLGVFLNAQWYNYILEIGEDSFTVEIGLLTQPMLDAYLSNPERLPIRGRI